jgi:hypothetical protein
VDTNLANVGQILDGNIADLPDYFSGATMTRWQRRRLLLTEALDSR